MSRTRFNENEVITSKTDLKGHIVYANDVFCRVSEMKTKEVIGQPHNIIRHPDMPRAIFKLLWDQISSGSEIFAYVKNMRFDGGFYWVYANVTASLDTRGSIVGYYSIRRKVNPKALEIIKPLYEKLLSLESQGGIEKSEKYLNQILEDRGESYEEFSNHIQRL
ncbi:MAG: PAS domain-containing protein [Campylobacteraceae bacterium]|nr:PAS domain-containing protein [Campylobacteraceae bacterium]